MGVTVEFISFFISAILLILCYTARHLTLKIFKIWFVGAVLKTKFANTVTNGLSSFSSGIDHKLEGGEGWCIFILAYQF